MKNVKKIVSIVLSLIMVFCIFACNSKPVTTTLEETTTKLIVGFDAEYPPYGYLSDDGKTYTGFDLDLAREVCKRTNMEFVAQPIDWDSKDMELNSGNISCIWNGFTINGRENDYTWSYPYVDNSIVLIVNADSDINTKADLAGKVVMVQAGSSGLAALTDEENADNAALLSSLKSLEQCPDYNTAFMNLESGVVDCVAVDIGVARYNLKNGNKFRQLDETVSSEQYAIGFKKGNSGLRDLVQNTLIEMWNDGTFMDIAKKYSDYSLPETLCFDQFIK